MSIIEDTIEYRNHMLRKLKKKYRYGKPASVLEAEKIIAKYNEEKANANPQIARLETEECPSSVCSECFYMLGISHDLKPIGCDDNHNDCFKCPECHAVYEEIA